MEEISKNASGIHDKIDFLLIIHWRDTAFVEEMESFLLRNTLQDLAKASVLSKGKLLCWSHSIIWP